MEAKAQFQVFSLTAPTAREHKRRKFHAKSRDGCVACKQKRVKCDESRPVCRRCTRTSRTCLYQARSSDNNTVPQEEEDQGESRCPRPRKTKTWRSSGGSLAGPPAGPLTQLPSAYRPAILIDYETPTSGTSTYELLFHFTQNYAAISQSAVPLDIWHIACIHPYLLTAILAVSACHLRHHAQDPRPHQVAECYQQRLTLRGFQQAVQVLTRSPSQDGADALITTAMFLNLLSFALVDDSRPRASWVFASAPDRLGWLALAMGLKPLLVSTEAFREDSALQPLFEASDDDDGTFSREGVGVHRIPLSWLGLLTPYVGQDGELVDTIAVFQEPLRVLFESSRLEAEPANFFLYLQFIGKLDAPFLQLLHQNDERALWTFGYWLGLLGRFRFWWSKARIERDYSAIVTYLRRRRLEQHDENGMWAQLMADIEKLQEDWCCGFRRLATIE